jgi:DNA end-binding protein Ku
MPHTLWKGAISFGLVHVPVALYSASQPSGVDFDWLDRRSMDPVGYRRINKRSGREIESRHIVRGLRVGDGEYVVLEDDEIRAAYPKTTQTVEIECFVSPTEIPFTLLDRPYYLEPLAKAEKVYVLLREAMAQAGVVGIARLVLQSKEHLAALAPVAQGLVLDTLRWPHDIRPWTDLKLPPAGKGAAQLKDAELKMARELIADMTQPWDGERFEDRFSAAIHALAERKRAAGKARRVQPLEDAGGTAAAASTNVVDLTELLRRSVSARRGAAAGRDRDREATGERSERKPARRRRAA